MKKTVLLFCLTFLVNISGAQNPVAFSTGPMTIILQAPTFTDNIKIITYVTTPNQGTLVSKSHSLTSNPNQLLLKSCYWNGMLAAIDEYVDTFFIGQLPAGTYTIKHSIFMSSSQFSCNPTHTLNATATLTVTGPNTTALKELGAKQTLRVFPNPAKDLVYFQGEVNFTQASLYSADGCLIRTLLLKEENSIPVGDLPHGLYFIRFSNAIKTEIHKLVRE